MMANNRIEHYAGSAGAPPARLMRDVQGRISNRANASISLGQGFTNLGLWIPDCGLVAKATPPANSATADNRT